MSIFDSKGMMIFPSDMRDEIKKAKNILVVSRCFCSNGHSLINPKAMFNNFPGIVVKLKRNSKEGLLALSPVYGDKSWISIDLILQPDELLKLMCPVCDEPFKIYSECTCGGDLLTLFTSEEKTFSDCAGICNRVGCTNAVIKSSGELLSHSMINAY